ncbi:unnamed protein product [Phaedon cochleariae]|uniref:Uncharacterized protein n=1 Tax=Phaedon cochleariae TaxID=80249 RepID=A0A9N9SEH4_PHACE|nr:unnamed protein product [Phaedon cochleariae]
MVLTREVTKEIKNAESNAMDRILRDQKFIKALTDNVAEAVIDSVSKKLSDIEQKRRNFEHDLRELKRDNEYKFNTLDVSIKKVIKEKVSMLQKYDNMEQETRRNNLRVFNYQEKNTEDTRQEIMKLFNHKLSTKLTDDDIEICYRIGKKEENQKPRGIFMKLKNHDLKQDIYKRKKLLKGTGVIIREDLTRARVELLTKTIEKVSIKNAWTDAGKIYVNNNSKISIIRSLDDFERIFGSNSN